MKTTLAEENEVISDASDKNLHRKIESDFKTVKFIDVDVLLYVYSFIRYVYHPAQEQSLVMCMKPVKKEINRLVDN